MSKKFLFFSSSRADFGLMGELIKALESTSLAQVTLVVNGIHNSADFGGTITEINSYKFASILELPNLYTSTTENDVANIMSNVLINFSKAIDKVQPDFVVLVGDRFETMASALASYLKRVKIIHFHGGEKTIGSFDDNLRHAITKLSDFHFVAESEYKNRVLQLGEQEDSIFLTGNLVGYKLKNINFKTKQLLQNGFKIFFNKKNIVVTIHPETSFKADNNSNALELLSALEKLDSNVNIFITAPNADPGASVIRSVLEEFSRIKENVFFLISMGHANYLSMVYNSDLVIGNSSSGVIEAPMLGIPSINIGSRQLGRVLNKSVINCAFKSEEIYENIMKVIKKNKSRSRVFEYDEYDIDKLLHILLSLNSRGEPKVFHDLFT